MNIDEAVDIHGLAMTNSNVRLGMRMRYPVTPDGRYFVVRGRLWRMSNPALSDERRAELTKQLMAARRDVGVARCRRGAEI